MSLRANNQHHVSIEKQEKVQHYDSGNGRKVKWIEFNSNVDSMFIFVNKAMFYFTHLIIEM
jgi:hypothetical protein